MERGQGRPLAAEKIDRIRKLLEVTDLSMPEIAQRMGCTRGRVVAINMKFQIRTYGSKRASWAVKKNSREAN